MCVCSRLCGLLLSFFLGACLLVDLLVTKQLYFLKTFDYLFGCAGFSCGMWNLVP